jgi:hypothetical protein
MASPYQLASRVGSSEVYADSILAQMTRSSGDAGIVRSTVDLGRNLGWRGVAEDVEDHVTWQQLDALGCDAIQGYNVSRPVAPTTSSPGFNTGRRQRPTRSASTERGLAGDASRAGNLQSQQHLAQVGPGVGGSMRLPRRVDGLQGVAQAGCVLFSASQNEVGG